MWAQIEPLLPPLQGRMGRPAAVYRPLIERAIFRLRAGVAWRDLRGRSSVRGQTV
jgi:transposase